MNERAVRARAGAGRADPDHLAWLERRAATVDPAAAPGPTARGGDDAGHQRR